MSRARAVVCLAALVLLAPACARFDLAAQPPPGGAPASIFPTPEESPTRRAKRPSSPSAAPSAHETRAGVPGSFSGTVRAGGAPLAGICVAAYPLLGSTPERPADAVRTDDAGRYLLRPPPAGDEEAYRVEFWDCRPRPAYAYQWFEAARVIDDAEPVLVDPEAQTRGVDAALRAHALLTGRVVDTRGRALEDVRVVVFDGRRAHGGGYVPATTVTTRADGGFTVRGLATGTYRLAFVDASGRYLAEWYDDEPLEDPSSWSGYARAKRVAAREGTTTAIRTVVLEREGLLEPSESPSPTPTASGGLTP